MNRTEYLQTLLIEGRVCEMSTAEQHLGTSNEFTIALLMANANHLFPFCSNLFILDVLWIESNSDVATGWMIG